MAQTSKKKKGGWFGWVWGVVILLGLLSNLAETTDLDRLYWRFRVWLSRSTGLRVEQAAGLLAVLIVAVLVIAALVRRGAGRTEKADRTGAAVRRPDPRTKSFTKPETYCAVHDHSGEDHLAHDKAQRIAQLDEWLKIGLIEKAEYRVLKDRYERDL